MDYDLRPPPTPPRRTFSQRGIILFWGVVWGLLMVWVFSIVNTDNGGWFDGPEIAAMIAGFGLIVGLAVLGVIVGITKLVIKDQAIRALTLLIVPAILLAMVLIAFVGA